MTAFSSNLLRGPCDKCGDWVSFDSGFEADNGLIRVCELCLNKFYPDAEMVDRPYREPEDISLDEACKRLADSIFSDSPLLKLIKSRGKS